MSLQGSLGRDGLEAEARACRDAQKRKMEKRVAAAPGRKTRRG
jgi:hypothetical protein